MVRFSEPRFLNSVRNRHVAPTGKSVGIVYSKLIHGFDAVTSNPVTILVEAKSDPGLYDIAIQSLDGEYETLEEFEREVNKTIDDAEKGRDTPEAKRVWNFLAITRVTAKRLLEALDEALNALDEAIRNGA